MSSFLAKDRSDQVGTRIYDHFEKTVIDAKYGKTHGTFAHVFVGTPYQLARVF